MDVYIYDASGEAIYKAVIPTTEETTEETITSSEALASEEASANACFRETVINNLNIISDRTEMIAIGLLLFATLYFITHEVHWWR